MMIILSVVWWSSGVHIAININFNFVATAPYVEVAPSIRGNDFSMSPMIVSGLHSELESSTQGMGFRRLNDTAHTGSSKRCEYL